MKTHDSLILAHLRANGRMNLTTMSRKTKIPVSTIHARLQRFNQQLLVRHTTLLNFNLLGYSARARVLLKVHKDDRQALREKLHFCPFLNELYKVNNGYDFMAEFIFEKMQDLETYLEELEERYSVEKDVYYILDEFQREAFLSKPRLETLGKQL